MSTVGATTRLGLLLAFIAAGLVMAAPDFPKLSGRVVDQANVLSRQSEQQIQQLSQAHEQATGNQVVVATVADLQGYDIADFGYQLGRHWGLGQKDKNNGVLLLLAKKERKVRIDVGYGLEGILTDAISSNIINAVMLPRFRTGQIEQGLVEGTHSVIQALGGEYQMRAGTKSRSGTRINAPSIVVIIIFLLQFLGGLGRGRRRRGGFFFLPMGVGGSRRGGGGFGGGFGGGGGSFGGGGASGGW